jgi:flagellar hook-length control protein FliK
MIIAVNPTLPVTAAQGVGQAAGSATAGLVLQPGTVVNAQVLKVADNLVQIAIANLAIDVLSEIALTPGQNLQLAVSQTESGIRLAVVGQGAGAAANTAGPAANAPVNEAANPSVLAAPSNDPLTPLERIAVSVASASAAAQQGSQAPLFANLGAALASNSLPPALQQAVAQVLAQQTGLNQDLTGGDIQNAFQKSGLFLESALASGSVSPDGSVPDLKAALIVLRQTLATAVGATENAVAPASATAAAAASPTKPAQNVASSPALAPSPETDGVETPLPQSRALLAAGAGNLSPLLLAEARTNAGPDTVTAGAVLNLLQETLQEVPRAADNASPTMVTSQGASNQDVASRASAPPPFRGSLPSAQPVASPSIPANALLATIARRLLDDTDAALARQTLLQVASLPDRTDLSTARLDPTAPRWNFEIPFATSQGTAMAQFEISRDGGGNEVAAAKRVWRARFSLDVEPAGPVHALISFSSERTSVRMWAERPQTAAQLRAGASQLSQALALAQLQPGDIVIREGSPPQAAPAKAGHFLDRAL